MGRENNTTRMTLNRSCQVYGVDEIWAELVNGIHCTKSAYYALLIVLGGEKTIQEEVEQMKYG